MDTKELNLDNINKIDMSINPAFLDDDDSFGSITISDTDAETYADDRNFQPKTGIIIDLSDDEDARPIKELKAEVDSVTSDIKVKTNYNQETDYIASTYNQIDMDTDYFDDDDLDLVTEDFNAKSEDVNFTNDTIELIDEKLIDGTVNANYWQDVAKRHAKSNKKGAHNMHFHIAGNPKQEQELFNAAMDTQFDSNLSSSDNVGQNITGGSVTACSGGESGGFGESLSKKVSDNSFTDTLRDLLKIINIEIIVNSDNSYTVLDLCDDSNEYSCKDTEALQSALQPYMEDCFIYPLQIATKNKFKTCAEWCNWYADENNRKLFPKCVDDIKYCDVIANHLDECVMEDLI